MTANGLIIDVIVFGGFAIFLAVGVVIVLLLTGERADPFRHLDAQRPADDPQEWTGPLLTGSTGAEKRMRRFHLEHGLILLNRASGRTRRMAAVLDARPVSRSLLARLRRAWATRVAGAPQALPRPAAPLPPLPPPPAVPAPELHAAPVAVDVEVADGSLAESHARALDALAWLDTPLPGDEETATQYPDWKTGQFAAYMKGEAS